MTLAMLLLTFGLVSGLVVLAFGRRQASRGASLATAGALAAGPVAPPALPTRRHSRAVDDGEAGVPRWLRQSVRAERFWTPEPEGNHHLRERRAVEFTDAPPDGVRMVVRYEDTSLFDGPNESYAAIIDRLHTGDEVLVIRMDGDWAEVRTPKGATGWLLSMVLGAKPAAPPPTPELATPVEAPSEPVATRQASRSRSRATSKRRPAPS